MSNHWRPTATIESLQQRAQLLQQIRSFFYTRNFLEVETPSLSQASVTDVYLASFETQFNPCGTPKLLYLQTSPEYHMKRLLAAGSGSIFQICKSFRKDEQGRIHNPEFSMLEWYRVGYGQHDLMDEMQQFLLAIIKCSAVDRCSYQDLFLKYLDINPHLASLNDLIHCANLHGINQLDLGEDKDAWLQVLMSNLIEPQLGVIHPIMIYDYPVSQAALAKIRQAQDYAVAERFEVYYRGIELANGFHELTDAHEQQQRFHNDLLKRHAQGLPAVPIDQNFLAALTAGLPACAGVAVGIDRLIMLALGKQQLDEVISFTLENA